MLTKEILQSMNKQITKEQFASNLYLSAGSWCMANGFEGAGKFLFNHAKEETIHMEKLFNYIIETGNQAFIDKIDKPEQQWNSLKDLFEYTLEHEKMITESINRLVALCFDSKDFSTFNFLQWYVAEQHEEEALFMNIIDKFKLIGDDSKSLFFLDREIGALGTTTA